MIFSIALKLLEYALAMTVFQMLPDGTAEKYRVLKQTKLCIEKSMMCVKLNQLVILKNDGHLFPGFSMILVWSAILVKHQHARSVVLRM